MSYHRGRIRKLHKAAYILSEIHGSTEIWLCITCGWSKIRFSKTLPKGGPKMILTFQVSVEVERESGKFISRADIVDEISNAIEDANPNEIEIEESTYNVVSWDIEEVKTK
jgi:hypothetical protein